MPILSMEERVGRTLDGKYLVGAPIATGGMGVVYRGEHTWTGRPVAIKVLQPGLSNDQDMARRFLTEARASASIRHPNVVDVLDMGKDEDGSLYMVLELLEGRDLHDILAEREVLTPAEAIAVLSPVLEALAFAHEKGFVHRDMKPSNVYVSIDARGIVVPKVLDFGIAKALDGGANKATRTGVIVGTPHYMAPEQASGVGVIGPASDTWSMGVLLFEALSGQIPFDGASPTVILMNVLGKRAPALRTVAPTVSPIIASLVDVMLDPDPDARPRDLRAHAKALRDAVNADLEAVLAELVQERPDRRERATAPTVLSKTPTASDPAPVPRPVPRVVTARTRADGIAARPTWLPWAVGAVVVAAVASAVWWSSLPRDGGAGTSALTPPTPPSVPLEPTPAAPPPTSPPTPADPQAIAPTDPSETLPPSAAPTPTPTARPGRPSRPVQESAPAPTATHAQAPAQTPTQLPAQTPTQTPAPAPVPPVTSTAATEPARPVTMEPTPAMTGPAPITVVEEEW